MRRIPLLMAVVAVLCAAAAGDAAGAASNNRIADPAAADRTLELLVNDGKSKVAHPAADSTPPTHALSVKGVSGKTAFKSGTSTLYYRGSNAGSFTVSDTLTDSGSGPLEVTYPFVSTGGWTHLAETVTSSPSFTSSPYSWIAGSTTSPGVQAIVGKDKALQTSTATLTLTNDTTGPTGQSVALDGGPTFSSLSVPLELGKGTDAGAGVDGKSGLVERASASYANGSCGTFGSWTTTTLHGGADTGVTSGNCYRYRYTISDVLGNTSTPSAPSANAIVDTSASPTTTTSTTSTTTTSSAAVASAVKLDPPTELSGAGDQYYNTGTLWFRPAGAGSFTLNAKAEAGTTSVTFPDVSATSGWSGSTGGTDTSSPYSSPVAYAWTPGASAPGPAGITAFAGTTQLGTVTVAINADSTAPTGQAINLSGGPFFATASVLLTISRGTDAGAGVDPSQDVVERATAPLQNGACGTFGTFTPVTLSAGVDATVATGNCYRWQLKVTDNVGNVSTASPPSADAKVDTTPPTVPNLLFSGLVNAGADRNVVYFRPGTSGSFTVTAASSDGQSGMKAYSFPTIAGFTQLGTGPSRTFTFGSSATPPVGPLVVTATNGVGLTSPAVSFTIVPDPTPPTVTVRCNGGPCLASGYARPVRVTVVAADTSGSGVERIRFTTNGTVPTRNSGYEYSSPFVVRTLTHLKVRAFDRAGNASEPLAITVRSLADRLLFGAPARLSVRSSHGYLQARVTSTMRAHVLAVMTGRTLKAPQRWRFLLESGAWIVKLRLPSPIGRGESYTLRWMVSAGTKRVTRVTQVTVR